MTDDELAAIEARCAAATPGPWAARTAGGYNDEAYIEEGQGIVPSADLEDTEWLALVGWARWRYGRRYRDIAVEQDEANAEFIAHSREDVPRLLAEVRRLRTKVD